jgi:hypothetical protein
VCIAFRARQICGRSVYKTLWLCSVVILDQIKERVRQRCALGKINVYVCSSKGNEEITCFYDSIKLKSWEYLIYDFFCLNIIRKGGFQANQNWRWTDFKNTGFSFWFN